MSGLDRIIPHWTAGTYVVSALDRAHYHFLINGVGSVFEGDHAPEANAGRLSSGRYAAHALNANSGSIGIGLCGMARATDRPFSTGPWPLREVQIEALVKLMASLCQKYGIPVSRETTLTHAELQPTLRIAQRGKWDISWLPGMSAPGDPVEVGDMIRARVMAEMKLIAPEPEVVIPPTIRRGDRGEDVRRLQKALLLRADGIFGPITQSELRSHQSEHGLTPDGICGPLTWATIIKEGY